MSAPTCPNCGMFILGQRCPGCRQPLDRPEAGGSPRSTGPRPDRPASHPAARGATVPVPGPRRPGPGSRPASWLADPSGRHEHRYWDGTDWTDHVADQGVPGVDPLAPAPPPVPGVLPVPGTSGAPAWNDPGSRLRDAAERLAPRAGDLARDAAAKAAAKASTSWQATKTSSPSTSVAAARTAVKVLNVVTLNSTITKTLQRKLMIPELVEHVKANPRDAAAHLWLGERLQHLERSKGKVSNLINITPTARIQRTVMRGVVKRLTKTREADGWRTASDRFLENAFKLANASLAKQSRSAADLHVLARIYRLKGMPLKAAEFAHAATLADPGFTDAYYTGADALLAAGRKTDARQWARAGAHRGSTMAAALLAQGVHRQRKKLAHAINPATHWNVMRACFPQVPPAELHRYFGPSPLAA
jgi:hypothetical protein